MKKYVTLCKENDATTEYYPNIETQNIPSKAIIKEKLDDNLQGSIEKIDDLVALTNAEIDVICV